MQDYEMLEVKSVEKIMITPEMAKSLLEKNSSNRPLSISTVKKYAFEMKQGSWKNTHQGIAVDETGQIIDGQHRLTAIIESGISIMTTLSIYKGNVKTLLIPLDRGKNRTVAEVSGIDKNEISMYQIFFALISPKKHMSSNPMILKELSVKSENEIAYIKEIFGRSVTSTSHRRGAQDILEMIWAAPVKAAILISIIGNIDVSGLLDFKNITPFKDYNKEFIEWYMQTSVIGKGGSSFQVTVSSMFFGLIKHKKFIPENAYEELDKVRTEMRKIIIKKYPEIFA
jgi:hypothetical protein